MVRSQIIEIKITNRTLKHYINKGYDIQIGQKIKINPEDLSLRSRELIEVSCDVCNRIKVISYQKYNKNIENGGYYGCSQKCSGLKSIKKSLDRYGETHPNKSSIIKNKIKKTILERYGYSNISQIPEFIEKIKMIRSMEGFNFGTEKSKLTCIEKYGVDNPAKNKDIQNKIKASKIANHIILPDSKLTEFHLYKKIVKNITYANKKKLYNSWNGIDYYDGEDIKENLLISSVHRDFPTIDHKISVYEGFVKNMDPIKIGSIENLCITKKHINSSKSNKTIQFY